METTESLITKIELNDDFKDNICDSQLFDKPLSTPSTPLSRLSISKKRKNIRNNCTSLTPKSDADVCKDIECFEKKITQTECRAQPQTFGIELNFVLEFEAEYFISLLLFEGIFNLIG